MSIISSFLRLVSMRRRAGTSMVTSLAWAAGLLWRDYQITRRRRHIERRAEVERATRQRL